MCRLFGMTTGGPRVEAAFWLLDAPQSLAEQSRRMPHGVGLGWFSLGDEPVRDRAPLPAYENTDFARAARHIVSHTFVSHIRYASTGAVNVHNCHPFDMYDRLFAHNGVVKGLDVLDTWLTDVDRALIEGQTDSERVFAYITAEIRRHGDTTTGLIEAIRRIADSLPLYSVNLLLAEANKIWALRYPESNELWALPPKGADVGGSHGAVRHLASPHEPGSVDLSTVGGPSVPAYVVASEPMDDDPGWRLLEPGELLVIDGLKEESLFPFDRPRHQLTEADLTAAEAASQEHAV
ncbi:MULTISPECIES: class II glutamine amidotransferase [Thermomonospora]|uniref:Glutamine amidotransferase n=1 Tax=Thermomonospora cellulosilytica TaxID=1411118 RepID=A0A7W3MZJ0_9ACTN|nr:MULTISPECIES: class II glutamine amidotransferase [Thermomonospora]MBA9004788.1 glutamine amidotransferase [Thermomonospora cellulosilytica]